jgi:hypothetical protein
MQKRISHFILSFFSDKFTGKPKGTFLLRLFGLERL